MTTSTQRAVGSAGRVADKVAVVTGGARGMGEAMVRVLAAEGARVVVADVLDEPGRKVADDLGDRDACGARPLRAVLRLAERHGAEVRVLDLRTSADTAGDPYRVVGYGAFAVEV